MARLTVEFVDNDWQVVEAGRLHPLGYFRTRGKAEKFKADLEAWQRAGAEPLCRPASTHPKYA